jgi:hypothetical protein
MNPVWAGAYSPGGSGTLAPQPAKSQLYVHRATVCAFLTPAIEGEHFAIPALTSSLATAAFKERKNTCV